MTYTQEIIGTGITFGVVLLARLVLERLVVKRILKKQFTKERKKMIAKFLNLVLTIILISGLISVWGLDHDQIIIFISSVVTVLGVAFFAQWSHLSNVTSGIILFFDSSMKIGDHITIMDKDFNISGKIDDIEALFVKIRTDSGELISIPNNIIMQKPVRIDSDKITTIDSFDTTDAD